MLSIIDKSGILFSKLNSVIKCSGNWLPLWKILRLNLEQHVTKQTYPKISCRSQKCWVQLINQQFYLVKWIPFSNMFEKWLPLWKIVKLVLEQNITSQTYIKISCRSQKCLVQLLNQQFYLVNWISFSNVSNSILWKKKLYLRAICSSLYKNPYLVTEVYIFMIYN